MGHSDRDCGVVYANPDKEIDRAYGPWLRAPSKNNQSHSIGARWMRNGVEGSQAWTQKDRGETKTIVEGDQHKAARFMEIDSKVSEISGDGGTVCYVKQNQRDIVTNVNSPNNSAEGLIGGNSFENMIVVTDMKRKRIDTDNNVEENDLNIIHNGLDVDNTNNGPKDNGPKNLIETGPVLQARLSQ